MDITLKNFILNRTRDKKRLYIHLHNTVSTQYSGDIRTIILCNLSDEAKNEIKEHGDKMFIEEATGFISVTLKNTQPVPVFVLKTIKVGEWKEQYDK